MHREMPNYLEDQNPFRLAGPPKHFLRQLWDFDSSLVVIPSRQGFYYRLAQRRPLRLQDKIVNEALFKESDTRMLASYGLVPVTTILATANWSNPLLFQDLADRAPWRNGGAEKVANLLDARDMDKDRVTHEKTDEMLTDLSKDGWKLYRKKIGLGRTWHSSATSPKHV